jgi:hypothetical protein
MSFPLRGLHEHTNPEHRVRVEHDDHTLLIHLSGEDGDGWTTWPSTGRPGNGRSCRTDGRIDTAREAYEQLYEP